MLVTVKWCWPLVMALLVGCEPASDAPENRVPLQFEEVLEKGIEGCMEYYQVPGCTWAVVGDTGIISGAAGYIYAGSNHEIEITDHFQVGSLGKSFTSLMAAKCVEAGLLDWESTIFEVLPDWEAYSLEEYKAITLADLLSHRHNLQPLNRHETHVDKRTGKLVYENIPNFTGTDPERRRAFCKYALSLPPVESEGLNYGNAGYSIAGCMLEKATGKTWEELALNTAADLGMDIGFGRPNRMDPFQPWGHLLADDHELEPVSDTETRVCNDPIVAPAGNIHVSISDFSNYMKQFMEGIEGRNGVVTAERYQYLLQGREPYAMGWYNDFSTDTIYYHYGSERTFYCHMMIFANLKSAIIIFTNAPGEDDALNFINDARNYLKVKHIYGQSH